MTRFVRYASPDGPRFGVVDDTGVRAIDGHPFGDWDDTGQQVPLDTLDCWLR